MNNSISFKMTGEEYYLGWKYKLNKGKIQTKGTAAAIILFGILLVVLGFAFDYELVAFIAVVFSIVMAVMQQSIQKKIIIQEYTFSKVLNGENTLKLYGEGIELINSYEKIYTPWQSIFAVKETGQSLIILPTFRKGVFVIDKSRYMSEELENIIASLRKNIRLEEGK